jgi:hypothetical protein
MVTFSESPTKIQEKSNNFENISGILKQENVKIERFTVQIPELLETPEKKLAKVGNKQLAFTMNTPLKAEAKRFS